MKALTEFYNYVCYRIIDIHCVSKLASLLCQVHIVIAFR